MAGEFEDTEGSPQHIPETIYMSTRYCLVYIDKSSEQLLRFWVKMFQDHRYRTW